MSNIGFMLDSEEEVSEDKLFKLISSKLNNLIKKKKIEISVEKVELYDNFDLVFLKLPYKADRILSFSKTKLNKVNNLIKEICDENKIEECLLADSTPDIFHPLLCKKNNYSGKYLYKSVLSIIIEEIFSRGGIKKSDLDITIIHGDNDQELYAIIKQLSPLVKYLTVIAENKDSIELEMDNIYYDTGLSIRVVPQSKNLLKNSDLIINLKAFGGYKPVYRINPKATVLNCSNAPINGGFIENVIINGIDIRLPGQIKEKLDTKLFKHLSNSEIAEMILSNRNCVQSKVLKNENDYETMGILLKGFKKDGYKIDGYLGRHGVLKNNEIRLYGT